MAKINNINDFIKKLQDSNCDVKFCEGFEPIKYKGQVCKLIAGGAVQKYLHKIHAHTKTPLPAHKDHGLFNTSLRKRAKTEIHSKVGEVYGPAQMEKVFNYDGFVTDSYKITDKEAYQQFILTALNQKQPVIVYFDVSPRLNKNSKVGEPGNYDGKLEHAAAIAGYFFEGEKLKLIAAQWVDFYEMSFDDLFASTSQLTQEKKPEDYRKYYPIPTFFKQKMWMEKDQVNLVIDVLANGSSLKNGLFRLIDRLWPKSDHRISNPPEKNSSLANIVTIIKGDSKKLQLDEFNKYLIGPNIQTPHNDQEAVLMRSNMSRS